MLRENKPLEYSISIDTNMGKVKQMNGKEICEAYARFIGIPEDLVTDWAKEFWELSPTGELQHVFAARDALVAAGLLPAKP